MTGLIKLRVRQNDKLTTTVLMDLAVENKALFENGVAVEILALEYLPTFCEISDCSLNNTQGSCRAGLGPENCGCNLIKKGS